IVGRREKRVKTIREERLGDVTLRLVHIADKYVGITIGKGRIGARVEGTDATVVWEKLREHAGQHSPGYVGYDGARKRFLSIFRSGFSDPKYAGHERDYKWAAKRKLDATLPLDKAADAHGAGEAALAVFRATNLLSPFEKTRMQAVLRGPY